MTEEHLCGDFQNRLDRLGEGTLTPGEMDALEAHAAGCEMCAILMEMHRYFAAPTLEELENQIPDSMVDTVWRRVSESIPEEKKRRFRLPIPLPSRSWMVPALAASMIVFILMNLLQFTQLHQLRTRENALIAALTRQTRIIEQIQTPQGQSPISQNADHLFQKTRLHFLTRQESFSITDLRRLLEQAPQNMEIISESYLQQVLSQLPRWEKARWEKALQAIESGDGIQPQEAIVLLDALPIGPDETISAVRLATLSEL
jgi:hypothetical protein